MTEDDLALIYGTRVKGQIIVGRLANAESIPVQIDLDKLIARHNAVLGSTGSRKSTTVASLFVRSPVVMLKRKTRLSSVQIYSTCIYGKYGRALRKEATVFQSESRQEATIYSVLDHDATNITSFTR